MGIFSKTTDPMERLASFFPMYAITVVRCGAQALGEALPGLASAFATDPDARQVFQARAFAAALFVVDADAMAKFNEQPKIYDKLLRALVAEVCKVSPVALQVCDELRAFGRRYQHAGLTPSQVLGAWVLLEFCDYTEAEAMADPECLAEGGRIAEWLHICFCDFWFAP